MRFQHLKPPAFKTALAEIEVEGTRLDLHAKLQLAGLTYGIAPATVTLGWAARGEIMIVRAGRALQLSGLALHFHGVRRFEVAIPESEPGDLEYFELRRDPEPALIFFFENGTVRVSAEQCHAELVIEGDDDVTDLVQ